MVNLEENTVAHNEVAYHRLDEHKPSSIEDERLWYVIFCDVPAVGDAGYYAHLEELMLPDGGSEEGYKSVWALVDALVYRCVEASLEYLEGVLP